MDVATVRALLVGESKAGYSPLLQRLQKGGCQCQFVASCNEGARLVAESLFDIVFCGSQMDGFQNLIQAVVESSSTLFRYVLVEDGCWWVPTILQGKYCAGGPALRPPEFSRVLDSLVRGTKGKMELRTGVQALAHSAR